MNETTIRANAVADLLFTTKPEASDMDRRAAWNQLVREMGHAFYPNLNAPDIRDESKFFLRALINEK